MVICIFIVCVMFSEMTTGMMRDEWFAFLVLYLVAALVYFAYELITTKKWKNLLTALPGLGIVALLNVGILLGMHAVENTSWHSVRQCRRSKACHFAAQTARTIFPAATI